MGKTARDCNGIELKVGDRVRYVGDYYPGALESGWLGTVVEVFGNINAFDVDFDKYTASDQTWHFSASTGSVKHIIKVADHLDALSKLIETANAGIEAVAEIYKSHRSEVEVSGYYNPEIFVRLHKHFGEYDSTYNPRKLRRKPEPLKPKLKPFDLGPQKWAVELVDESTIRIGCKKFYLHDFKVSLFHLLIKDWRKYGILDATRKGVECGEHTLPWEDAEMLYERIKDL